jgi:RloB-like protein
MARNRNAVHIKPVLFIACEGSSSEFQYFESWAESDAAKENFEKVNVYPDEREDKPKTTPYQLLEKAKNVLLDGSANFAWIVFDKDNHPKLQETFVDASTAGVKIAFSSRSFEEWVLMHFQKSDIVFEATECKDEKSKPINCGSAVVPNCTPIECLTGHIRRNNLIPNYSKKKTFDLFAAINFYTEVAFVNAAWLRYKFNASLNVPQPLLQTLNPYTDVDQLVFNLNGRNDKIEWGISGDKVCLNDWIINATLLNGNIIVQLAHTKPQAIAINEPFLSNAFFTTDDDLNNVNCTIISKQLILNNNGSLYNLLCVGDIVEYTLQANNQPYFVFNHEGDETRIYVML